MSEEPIFDLEAFRNFENLSREELEEMLRNMGEEEEWVQEILEIHSEMRDD